MLLPAQNGMMSGDIALNCKSLFQSHFSLHGGARLQHGYFVFIKNSLCTSGLLHGDEVGGWGGMVGGREGSKWLWGGWEGGRCSGTFGRSAALSDHSQEHGCRWSQSSHSLSSPLAHVEIASVRRGEAPRRSAHQSPRCGRSLTPRQLNLK